VLHSTGRQRRAHSLNAPLVRIYVQMESLPLAAMDAWPEGDEGPIVAEAEMFDEKGVFSGEEEPWAWEEEEEEDGEEREVGGGYSEDEDEWVETVVGATVEDDDIREVGKDEELLPLAEREKFAELRRALQSKVLNGTRKIASMTLKPVRAVKEALAEPYHRIKVLRAKGRGLPVDAEASAADMGGEWDNERDYLSGEAEEEDEGEGENAIDDFDRSSFGVESEEWQALVARVEGALSLADAPAKAHGAASAPLLLVIYPGTRRGLQLKRLFDAVEEDVSLQGFPHDPAPLSSLRSTPGCSRQLH